MKVPSAVSPLVPASSYHASTLVVVVVVFRGTNGAKTLDDDEDAAEVGGLQGKGGEGGGNGTPSGAVGGSLGTDVSAYAESHDIGGGGGVTQLVGMGRCVTHLSCGGGGGTHPALRAILA